MIRIDSIVLIAIVVCILYRSSSRGLFFLPTKDIYMVVSVVLATVDDNDKDRKHMF